MEIMLKNKNGFQVNISLSIFFIDFCDVFTDFPSYGVTLASNTNCSANTLSAAQLRLE
jgi:hypothetical protein